MVSLAFALGIIVQSRQVLLHFCQATAEFHSLTLTVTLEEGLNLCLVFNFRED